MLGCHVYTEALVCVPAILTAKRGGMIRIKHAVIILYKRIYNVQF